MRSEFAEWPARFRSREVEEGLARAPATIANIPFSYPTSLTANPCGDQSQVSFSPAHAPPLRIAQVKNFLV